MLINKNWLFRQYREEFGEGNDLPGSAEGDNKPEGETNDQEQTPEGQAPADRPEWLLPKYATEGKTDEEAIAEQAKAYNELSGKFGSFTGSPDDFSINLSNDLTEAGIALNADDPMVEQAMAFAKESNMNQEGFDKMIGLYAMQQLAEEKAQVEYRDEQLNSLDNADNRIKNINEFISKNFDAETVQGIQGFATNVESIKALEQLIARTGNKPLEANNSNNNSGVTAEEVRTMQFAKDQHGNRRIQTDPAFRAEYKKKMEQIHGTEDYKQQMG